MEFSVSATRVLVVGVGSIGGTVAGGLAGHPPALAQVVGLTSNRAVAKAVSERGYGLKGVDGARFVPGRVVTELDESEPPFDFIILSTQPPQVEAAARTALPWLAKDGRMVVLQNGLCEDRVAKLIGSERFIGAVVGWGASTVEPGLFERTSEGGFTIGRMDGDSDPALAWLALLLEIVGPVTVSDNLAGARWSKLAINCTVSTLGTIGGDTLGMLMPFLVVRRLALHLMSETAEVAMAQGIKLEKISGTFDLGWLKLTDAERKVTVGSSSLVAKHTLLLAVGMRYRRLRSSMLAAIERGRPPAVDFLNGEVVERGQALGVPTPVNAAALRMVHAIARGERQSGMHTIRQLATEVGLQFGTFTGSPKLLQ